MTNNKTNKASASGAKKPACRRCRRRNRIGQRAPAAAPPAAGPRAGRQPSTRRIAKAQKGRVNVTPAKAIEMAGQLYSRGQYAAGRAGLPSDHRSRGPANADAHNILGVSLAALGKSR